MDTAVLDSDASLDYRSPLRDRAPEPTGSISDGGAPQRLTAQAILARILERDREIAGLSAKGNGAAGAIALPRPELLPPPSVGLPYESVHGLAARVAKRVFDLIGAILLIVLLAPIWLAIALAIKLDSPGPVLFRQRRIGHNGEPFRMFKFRTMVDGADEQKVDLFHLNEAAEGLFKINGDPRITGVGGRLRAISLDELPQLLNVITGRMSLVGPRPLVPEEDAMIVGEDRLRLAMRPGMTGVWQVGGASTIPIRKMVVLDRGYLDAWSLWLDLKLLAKTAQLVALRRGV
jgi:lipopolysaccharide/colanic/teichoic acid biosynthesis glycosyltransferase